jgi:hypothetical protein
VTNDTEITEAWARYHGPPLPGDDEIPQAPPAYSRGYRDGVASISKEVRSVLGDLDIIAAAWGDEDVFRRCRDRLRAILK